VRGSGPGDFWVAGSAGRICHWDDRGFNTSEAWVRDEFHGLWAFSPTDVWAVGCCGPVLHFDGTSWSRVSVGLLGATANAVWGAAPDDVWVAGDFAGTGSGSGYSMLHLAGTTWSLIPIDGGWWYGLWGSGPNDVWVVGINRQVGRWDGTVWTVDELAGLGADYRAVWGSGPADVWIVGDEGTIVHYRE
jgi:hypothetical protein